ncbi:hypothetical protein BH10ACT3_BH10ACT3_21610 [soil metagenome]
MKHSAFGGHLKFMSRFGPPRCAAPFADRPVSETLGAETADPDRRPMALEIERKYLLATPQDMATIAMTVEVSTSEIDQIYLDAEPGAERRCRRRVRGDQVEYTTTEKRPTDDPTVREEFATAVDADAWQQAAATDGPRVSKRRHVFDYDGQRFELDELLSPRRAWVLELELADADQAVRLPPFLDIETEFTDDPNWRNVAIARDGGSGSARQS